MRTPPFRIWARPSPLPDRVDLSHFPRLAADFGFAAILVLTWISPVIKAAAATTVVVNNEWAYAQVRIVTPKPSPSGAPPVRQWSQNQFGAASIDLQLTQSGTPGDYFVGSAFAKISPTLALSSVGPRGGHQQLFAASVLADDTLGCEAEATIDSIWNFTVSGEPISFYASTYFEMGHGVEFTLHDLTLGLPVASRRDSGSGGYYQTGMLEPAHDYQLVLHNKALLGGGDGYAMFGFGFEDSANIDFSPTRTHLAIPEPTQLSMLAAGSLVLLRRRRK